MYPYVAMLLAMVSLVTLSLGFSCWFAGRAVRLSQQGYSKWAVIMYVLFAVSAACFAAANALYYWFAVLPRVAQW